MPTPLPSQQPSTVSSLQIVIDKINQKIELYDDLDPGIQDYLEKIKSGKDKEEAQKCFRLLKELSQQVGEISNKNELNAAITATEDFDRFCGGIFPKELFDRYFAPKFHKIYDILDDKVIQLDKTVTSPSVDATAEATGSVSQSTDTVRRGVGSDPSIVNYLDKIGWPSDFKSRAEYAVKYKIVNSVDEYKGSSDQNTKLLDAIIDSKQIEPEKITKVPSATGVSSGESTQASTTSNSNKNDYKTLLATDKQGNSLYFVRISAGSYRPAVVADQRAGVQLFLRNPNPALRMVYPFIKVQSAPIRRASPV